MALATPILTNVEFVQIQTTLPRQPFPSFHIRERYRSERLCLRELRAEDAEALYQLRRQPEVMRWSSQGHPDADLAATQKHLATMLPPNDTAKFHFAICLQTSGELLGIGGCHQPKGELGWPVIGYMFRSEYWGKGYATEFVKAFLLAWWALPREKAVLHVDRSTCTPSSDLGLKPERMIAITDQENKASQHVLQKCGWNLVKVWQQEDECDPSKVEVLYGFAALRSSQ